MDGNYVRTVDTVGRIVIPSPARRFFNLVKGDRLTVQMTEDRINLRRRELVCALCASADQVRPFRGKGICSSCTEEINQA